jgi:8-oxo-dGTP pyrophosphatase MutT (NUDIX family)
VGGPHAPQPEHIDADPGLIRIGQDDRVDAESSVDRVQFLGQDSVVTIPDVPVVEKVVAYIVRSGQLAVFIHLDDSDPVYESGLQVPAGTIEPGEMPERAVLREANEETGLIGLRIVASLGLADYDVRPGKHEVHRRRYFQLAVDGPVRPTWDYAEVDGGAGQPRNFRFSWLPLTQGHSLVAGFGSMLAHVDASAS